MGSSARTSRGLRASAQATAARWRWPPDRRRGVGGADGTEAEGLDDAGEVAGAVGAGELGGGADVLLDGEELHEAVALRDVGDGAGAGLGQQALVAAAPGGGGVEGRAGRGRPEGEAAGLVGAGGEGEEGDQRRLAAAARADERDAVAGGEGEVRHLEGEGALAVAARLDEAVDGDDGRGLRLGIGRRDGRGVGQGSISRSTG